VDARILKWHALANLLGLSTAYELDRVGGRFRGIEQERFRSPHAAPARQQKPLDLFDLRKALHLPCALPRRPNTARPHSSR